MVTNQLQNLLRVYPAQAHVGTGHGSNGPGETPAIAVKHRQRPQVHRVHVHGPHRLVAQRVDVGTAVVVHHAFGITGSAGGVVQGNGIPLIFRETPLELRVPFLQEGLVIQVADLNALTILRVIHVNHQRLVLQMAHRILDHLTELPVSNHHLGFAMLQHEGDGFGIQANVQGIEHGTDHRDAEMALHHGRNVRQHHGNGVAPADSTAFQGRCQAQTAVVGFSPGAADSTVDDGRVIRIHTGRALDKIYGGLNSVVRVPGL